MRKQSNVILGSILVLAIVLFAVLNNKNVPISFGFTSFSAPSILMIIGPALIGALVVLLIASATLWQQKKQIKQLTQEISEYRTDLQKKVEEAKEEQQREFRNERAELEVAYQVELQAETMQISRLKAPEEQKTQVSKQSFNYSD